MSEGNGRGRHGHVDGRFGERLRALRAERGMAQRELAFPGCTAVYICRIERGDRVPSLQVVRELARRLRVDEGWLATGEGSPEGPFVVVRLDRAALDAEVRRLTLGEHGLADLEAEDVARLVATLRENAEVAAAPVAVALLSMREYPVGTA